MSNSLNTLCNTQYASRTNFELGREQLHALGGFESIHRGDQSMQVKAQDGGRKAHQLSPRFVPVQMEAARITALPMDQRSRRLDDALVEAPERGIAFCFPDIFPLL